MFSKIVTITYKKFLDVYLKNHYNCLSLVYFKYADGYVGECKYLNGYKPVYKWKNADGFYILRHIKDNDYQVIFIQHPSYKCFLGFKKLQYIINSYLKEND